MVTNVSTSVDTLPTRGCGLEGSALQLHILTGFLQHAGPWTGSFQEAQVTMVQLSHWWAWGCNGKGSVFSSNPSPAIAWL